MNRLALTAPLVRRHAGSIVRGLALFVAITGLALADGGKQPFPAATPESVGIAPESLEKLRAVVQQLVDRDEIAGAELLVVKNRRTVLHTAFGSKDRESKTAMTPNTIFCVRSMTKPVVGVAIQMLADEGKLSIDDPVAKHLPAFDTEKCRAITIRHLLTHTSGLPLSSLLAHSLAEVKDLAQVAQWTAEHGPDFTPGARWQYSDDGADTLGAIVAKVSGKPTDEFVTKRILEPLGMRDSICVVRKDDPRTPRIASSYAGGKGAWFRFYSPSDSPIFPIFLCSQGLYSTTADYARFLAMFLDRGRLGEKRLLSEAAVARVLEPCTDMHLPTAFDGQTTRYGQMMMCYVDGESRTRVLGHGGSDGTHAYAFPDRDLMVFYFTQSRGNLTFMEFEKSLHRLLIDPVAGAKAEAAEKAAVADLGPYVGVYFHEQQRSPRYCAVQLSDGKLVAEYPWECIYTLKPDGAADRFAFELAPPVKMTFQRDEKGAITGFEFNSNGRKSQWNRHAGEPGLPSIEALMALREKAHHASKLDALPVLRLSGSVKRVKPSEVSGEFRFCFQGASRRRSEFTMATMSETIAIDGERVFKKSADQPAEELAGAAAEAALLDSVVVAVGDWRQLFATVRVLRRADMDGRPALVVRCTPKLSPAHTYLVDAETGSVLGKQVVESVPGMGLVGSTTRFEDFRDVEGVTMPFKISTRYASPMIGTFVVQFEKVEKVSDLAPDAFRLEPGK